MPIMAEVGTQAVAGVTPPQVAEAIVRDAWPGIASNPAAASLARRCYQSVFLAPIGWLVTAPFLLKRLIGALPGFSGLVSRYRLTNKRLMRCIGFQPKPVEEVSLDKIKDVRFTTDETAAYFTNGNLEIIGDNGQVLMKLTGIREAESFGHAIRQTAAAWGPLVAHSAAREGLRR
jgi:hypothetical protein